MIEGSPNIILDRYKMSSDWELVTKIDAEFNRHYQVQYNEILRMERNFRAYTGLDGGAWTDKDLEKLKMEDRTAYILNLCRGKVDTMTGLLLADKMEMDWQPLEKGHTEAAQMIKDIYNIDKDLGDYEMHYALATRDGNVGRGELEITVDRGQTGLPYIRFVRLDPAYCVRDSDWLSDDDTDCEQFFKVAFLTPMQLRRIFKAKGAMIDQAIDRVKRFGKNPEAGVNPWEQVSREIKGDTYRTIIHYWMDHQKVTILSGRKLNSFVRMSFPQDLVSEKREEFMMLHKVDPFTLRETIVDQKVNMVSSICSSLMTDALLGNGKSEVQVGRLPQRHFTNMRVQGRDLGVVDSIIHINQLIQKDESKISDLIATAQGGGLAVNHDAFKSPKDRHSFEKKGNDPSAIWFMNGDVMSKERVFERIPTASYPSTVVDRVQRMYDVVDKISGVDKSLEAVTSSSESGVLYDKKVQIAKIGLTLQTLQNKTNRNRMGEDYVNQIRQTYKGPRREFSSRDGKTSVVMNERIAKDNKIYIKNSPLMLPRCAVYVTESNESLSKQMAIRGVLFNLFERVAQTHPEYASLMIREIIRTVSIGDDKVEARLNAIADMQEVRDFSKLKADITGLDASSQEAILNGLMAKTQTMQMLAGQGVPDTQEGSGMEVEQAQLQQQTA